MSRSTAERLRALASEVESTHRQHMGRISSLETQLSNSRIAEGTLEDRVEELDDANTKLESEISALKSELKEARDNASSREEAQLREIAALRFDLAQTKKDLRTAKREAAWNQNSTQAGVTGSGLDLSGLIDAEDHDLVLPEDFVSAARRGLTGIIRDVLKPSVNEWRESKLKEILGKALIEVAAQGPSHVEALKLLLEQGADVNATRPFTEDGRSALHVAAAKGHKEILSLLLSQPSIRLDPLDSRGRTPLHLASRLRKVEAARVLLRKGADPDALTREGQNAKDLAKLATEQGDQWFSLSFSPMSITQVFENPSVMFWNASALGLRHYKDENWTESHKYFTRAVDVISSSPQVANSRDLSRLYYNRAKVGIHLGEVLQALRDSEEAISRNANYLNAIEIRADCYLKLFDFERAENDYDRLCDMTLASDDPSVMSKYSTFKVQREKARKCRRATHYQILGVSKRSTPAQIKRAFRTSSIMWHPDKHSKSEEDRHRAQLHFQRINEAREILLDSNRRIIYDSEQRRSHFWAYDDDDDEDDEDEEDDYYDAYNDDKDQNSSYNKFGSVSNATKHSYPWLHATGCKPLADDKVSFQTMLKERAREQAEREAAEEAARAAKRAADAAATLAAQRDKQLAETIEVSPPNKPQQSTTKSREEIPSFRPEPVEDEDEYEDCATEIIQDGLEQEGHQQKEDVSSTTVPEVSAPLTSKRSAEVAGDFKKESPQNEAVQNDAVQSEEENSPNKIRSDDNNPIYGAFAAVEKCDAESDNEYSSEDDNNNCEGDEDEDEDEDEDGHFAGFQQHYQGLFGHPFTTPLTHIRGDNLEENSDYSDGAEEESLNSEMYEFSQTNFPSIYEIAMRHAMKYNATDDTVVNEENSFSDANEENAFSEVDEDSRVDSDGILDNASEIDEGPTAQASSSIGLCSKEASFADNITPALNANESDPQSFKAQFSPGGHAKPKPTTKSARRRNRRQTAKKQNV
mmetsp:Transcript_2957/g.6851  ORF Transcript_2957/g.6851 Transcript_2957/m.6851 type:complete len:980 (-) Transcript_2957:204-3143(-)